MNRVRLHVPLAAAMALAVGVLLAGPAAAFTADGTATLAVTSTDPAQEFAPATISGECPVGTVSASIQWNWTTTAGPQTGTSTPTINGADGTFSDLFYLYNFALPSPQGTTYSFDLACSDGASTLATASQTFVVPDFGQTASVPATVVVSNDVLATVDCGTGTADSLYVRAYLSGSQIYSESVAYTGPGSYNLGTPSSMGFAAADAAELSVTCQSSTPSTHGASYRLVYFAAVAATPPAPVDAAGPALAETGVSPIPTTTAAVVLAIAGLGIVTARRRRTTRSTR